MRKKRNRKSPDYRGIALKLYNEKYNPNPQTKALGDVLESGVKFIDDKVFGDTKVGNIIEEVAGTAGNVVQGIYAPTPDAWAGVAADFSGLVADTASAFTKDKFEVDPVTGEQILDEQGNPIPKISGVEKIARNVEAGGESAQGFLSGNWQKGVSSGADFVDKTVENVTDFEGEKEDTDFQKGIKTGKNVINTGLQVYNKTKDASGQITDMFNKPEENLDIENINTEENVDLEENLNSGENLEEIMMKRGGNVQDRINRMRSYLGGHKVSAIQPYANSNDVDPQPTGLLPGQKETSMTWPPTEEDKIIMAENERIAKAYKDNIINEEFNILMNPDPMVKPNQLNRMNYSPPPSGPMENGHRVKRTPMSQMYGSPAIQEKLELARGSRVRPYEQGAEVELDPTLQGLNDLTVINRQSGEVVRRNYPGTEDNDVKNYYEYTGTSHANVRPGMPNGGNDAQEQVGAFIFPKKHAKSIKKIVRDRKYYQDIINKSKSA